MNPKKEFVNAVMSVLRLEQNIYTVATLEEIIDRVDTQDYTMFIAYLGERNADYEKPIQTIANAVDEFHKKKVMPKIEKLCRAISKEINFVENIKIIEDRKEYEKIDPDKKHLPYYDRSRQALLAKSEDWFTSKKLTHKKTGAETYLDLQILKDNNISIQDIIEDNVGDYRENITRKYYRPSVTDKIETSAQNDANAAVGIESSRTKSIIASAFPKAKTAGGFDFERYNK